jgi:hypothetical protein
MSAIRVGHSNKESEMKNQNNGMRHGKSRVEHEGVLFSMTPEERWKIQEFESWMEETAQSLELKDTSQAERNRLYRAIQNLRPYDPMKNHEKAKKDLCKWERVCPQDPLIPKLTRYLNGKIEEAKDLRETFPEVKESELPSLIRGSQARVENSS